MTQEHPITPPPELLNRWDMEGRHQDYCTVTEYVAFHSAQWGADQELEACVKWLNSYIPGNEGDRLLRTSRRPKPLSLKEQALALINHDPANQPFLSDKGIDTIRRALEQLPD